MWLLIVIIRYLRITLTKEFYGNIKNFIWGYTRIPKQMKKYIMLMDEKKNKHLNLLRSQMFSYYFINAEQF